MHTATLFTFKLPRKEKKITPAKASKLYRELYGYENYSCYGKYRTHVHGLLEKLNGIFIDSQIFIIKNKYSKQMVSFLKKYSAKIFMWKVILNDKEAKKFHI